MKQNSQISTTAGVFSEEPSFLRDPVIWLLAVLSLALHLLVAPNILGIPSKPKTPNWSATDDAPLPPQTPKVRAGIEKSERSTLTWLGFAEPEPHEAKLDTLDQAALSPTPVAAPPNPVSEPVAGTPAEAMPTPVEQPAAPATPALAEVIDRSLSDGLSQAIELAVNVREQALIAVGLAQLAASQRAQAVPTPEAEPEKPEPPAEPTEAVQAQAKPGIDPDADGQDDKPKAGRVTAAEAAVESPKDSLATSTIKPIRVRPGKPAAAEGLDITTVRPKWTYVTRLSALPRDPVIAVDFAKDGRVLRAAFVVGKSTGDDRVDGPLLDAMYNWTAKGRALDDLPKDGTIRMTFAIDLGAR